MTRPDTDVLVIGAGPAGASVAIRLARLGWQVTLAEQSQFPRQKVCGECLGPASLELLGELGLGEKVSELAGPPIRQVAWMARYRTVTAEMPACRGGQHAYGRAIGRDCLDRLLLEHAKAHGVNILQPAKILRIAGGPGDFNCSYERRDDDHKHSTEQCLTTALVIDAHGSWERGPEGHGVERELPNAAQQRPSDLLAFKATFTGAGLTPGVLPVLCLPGGYGGMVVSDRGRTTIACCIQRGTLRQLRQIRPGSAGDTIESYLHSSCAGVAAALRMAHREGSWHAVGPLRTGFHPRNVWGVPRIGNAAAEAHPLIGEGICMALQSAAVFAQLCAPRPKLLRASYLVDAHRRHSAICRQYFARRMGVARLYARVAMQPSLANAAAIVMQNWPATLTAGARLAGKARHGVLHSIYARALA